MAIQIDPSLQAKLDQAFQRFWFQDNEQLKAFVQQFVWDNRISLPEELQQVEEYAANRYPYWKLPVIIPKPASPTIPPMYPDSPQQTLPERTPGTFWETPMGTWAKDHWLMLSLGGIAFWYLLDTPKGKKKRSNPLGLSSVSTESDDFADCECDLEGSECADVQPASESPVSEAVPGTVGARRELLTKCGSEAFLMPDGTAARPGVPGYPVMIDDCCYHCGLMRAAYTRIGQAMARSGSRLEKFRLRDARKQLIRKAASFADKNDKTNACNWAFAAAKKYKVRLSGLPFELGRAKQSELFTVPRGQIVLTEQDIAESDDKIIQCLERQGWKPKRIKEIQESIAEKLTPSLFTSLTEELTGGEAMYQEAVDECLERIRKGRGSKRAEMELFLGGDGCRDKDGNFVPVAQCTGRMKPKKEKEPKAKAKPEKKKAPSRDMEPWMMTRDEWQNEIDKNKPETAQSRPTKRDKSEALARARRLAFLHAGVDAPWDPEFREIRRITHRDVILKAMSEGKDVRRAGISAYKGIVHEATALKALRESDGATMTEFLDKVKWMKPKQAKALFKTMLDNGNLYEIDGIYYPFELARVQRILEKKEKKPAPAEPEPELQKQPDIPKDLEPKPVDVQHGTQISPWMAAAPFTEKEQSYGNMYTHFPLDWNEQFIKDVKSVEDGVRGSLAEYGIEEPPQEVMEALENYRKSTYDYIKQKWANRAYYPPVSVVGPSKYPYKRKDKAMARGKRNWENYEKAKKRLEKAERQARSGLTPKITIDTHMDVAAHSSKVSFGNQYAKMEMAGKANMRGFEHVYRKRGRELHKSLVEEAIKQNKKVIWKAVKEYPELHDYQNIIDKPLKSQMTATQHERIINAKPKGGRPTGYHAYLRHASGKTGPTKYQWVWGKPTTIPGFREFNFFTTKYEGKYSVHEASTGMAITQPYSSMDSAFTNAKKALDIKRDHMDDVMDRQEKIADHPGMKPVYKDMISKITVKTPTAKEEAEAELIWRDNQEKILEVLHSGEMHIDDIIIQTRIERGKVAAALAYLELKGKIHQKAGNMFELSDVSVRV